MTLKNGLAKAIRKTIGLDWNPITNVKVATFSTYLAEEPRYSFVQFKVIFNDDPNKDEKTVDLGLNDLLFAHRWTTTLWGDSAPEHRAAMAKLPDAQSRVKYLCNNI